MIPRYSDHAANERTMLAWVRTALAVIAFGLLVEKLNLFLRLSAVLKPEDQLSAQYAEWIGILLIGVGVLVIVASLLRYFRISHAIESENAIAMGANKSDALLFLMIAAMVIAVALFFGHAIGIGG